MLKTKVSKIAVVAVVAALALGAVVASHAPVANAADYVFTRDLTLGSSGADVLALQAYLNHTSCCHVAESGAGSVGNETQTFGPLTRAALAKFQASVGITPAVGYFGPISRAYVNSHGMGMSMGNLPAGCSSTAGYSPTTGVKCDTPVGSSLPAGCTSTAGFSSITGVRCDSGVTTTPPGNTGPLSGGETSISNVDVSDADDSTLEEGASKAEVAMIEFDVDDADAELNRADLIFDGTGNDEEKPWNVFDKVYLMNGSDVIASMDTDSKDAWDETDVNDVYRVRLSGVNEIFREGDNAELTVAVDVASSVDGADTGDADWDVEAATETGDADGLRFVDGAGIDTFEGDTNTASFSIEQAGAQSEFTVQEADNSPDADTLEVKENQTTTETIGIFTMEADEDGGDVKLDDFPVQIAMVASTTNTSMNDVIDEVMVDIDGTTYDGDYVANSCGGSTPDLSDCDDTDTATFAFDNIEDDDIVINAGDSMDAEVSVKFKAQGDAQSNYSNGATIAASTDDADWDTAVEDADSGDDIGDISADADADTFTLAANGLGVENTEDPASEDVTDNAPAKYTFEVDVTAFGDDQWVELNGTQGTSESDTGFNFLIEQAGSATTTGTASIDVQADKADDGSNRVRINKNETVHFTVTITYDAATSGLYTARLYSANFAGSNANATDAQVLSPASTWRTPPATAS